MEASNKHASGNYKQIKTADLVLSLSVIPSSRGTHDEPPQTDGLSLVIGSTMFKEPKRHICNLCGKEFRLGQALGGILL
jgi:hypothetical protein